MNWRLHCDIHVTSSYWAPLKASGHYMYRTAVTICTAQWSLYVPHSGHYMYPHSGHCIYRTVVAICTAQLSLYVPHSGHYVPHSGRYMYRAVVAVCTAQWSLYVPHSGRSTYHKFNTNYTFCPHSVCVLCGSENKQRLFHCTALTDWFV